MIFCSPLYYMCSVLVPFLHVVLSVIYRAETLDEQIFGLCSSVRDGDFEFSTKLLQFSSVSLSKFATKSAKPELLQVNQRKLIDRLDGLLGANLESRLR